MNDTSVQQEATQASGRAGAPIFEASSEPGAGAGVIAYFVLSLVLFLGGLYLMSLAFGPHDYGFLLFSAGLIVDALGLGLAFTSMRGR